MGDRCAHMSHICIIQLKFMFQPKNFVCVIFGLDEMAELKSFSSLVLVGSTI